MHRSLMSMEGMPVLSEEGVRLGVITDAWFDPFEQRIVGFAVDWENNLVRGPDDMLPILQISELNADVATVPEMAPTAGLDYMNEIETEGLVAVIARFVGHPVEFASGTALGELVDLIFDPQDGSVESFEITERGERADQPSFLLSPRPDLDFQDHKLVLPDAARGELRHKNGESVASLGIAFLEVEDEEDQVGEEDIEVSRTQRTQPY